MDTSNKQQETNLKKQKTKKSKKPRCHCCRKT